MSSRYLVVGLDELLRLAYFISTSYYLVQTLVFKVHYLPPPQVSSGDSLQTQV